MIRRLLLILIVLSPISGCTRYYYNAKYPSNEQQRYFAGDHGYCLQVSHGSVPMPQLHSNTQSGYLTSGTVSNMNGQSYRYQGSVTPQPDVVGSFMNGMNIGNALNAEDARGDIYEGCLIRLGWSRIECKTCIPTSSALTQASGQIQDTAKMLEAAGFDEPINSSDGKSTMYFKKSKLITEGEHIIVDVAQLNLKGTSYQFDNVTYTPLYITYKYYINKSLSYYKVSQLAIYDKSSNKVYNKNYPTAAMPTYYYNKGSIVDTFIGKI